MRLLIVEDDQALADVLARDLREKGFAVDHVTDGEQGVVQVAVNSYDAIILDVGLPGMSGIDVSRRLRSRGIAVPILMLTARDTLADRVTGLDSGADDYLTKPFELDELHARLRALLRRMPGFVSPLLRVGDLEIDTHSHRVKRGGVPIALTTKEFVLIEHLARHAGRIVGRTELCEHLWDENHDPFSNAIEVYINRLRKKIDEGADHPLIHTRRGVGYMLGADAGGATSGPGGKQR